MSDADMLTAVEEARLVAGLRGRSGPVHASTISRARQDPAHPAHLHPDGSFTDGRCDFAPSRSGPAARAPREAVLQFWEPRLAARPPQAPAGLTPARWAALQALAADPDASVSPAARKRLTEAGYLDPTGQVTATGRQLVDQHAATAAQPQEQR